MCVHIFIYIYIMRIISQMKIICNQKSKIILDIAFQHFKDFCQATTLGINGLIAQEVIIKIQCMACPRSVAFT